MSAAGGPPRKTIARTRARKLPEVFSLELVSIAVRSLKIEKPSRIPKSAKSQLAWGARQSPKTTIATPPAASSRWLAVVGRVLFIGSAWAATPPGFRPP